MVETLPEDFPTHEVADPYRLLEDAVSPETVAWLVAQDELWQRTRAGGTAPEPVAEVLRELYATGTVSPPYWHGERCFRWTWDGTQEHGVGELIDTDGTRRVVLDANTLDASGTTVVDHWRPSVDGARLAYQLSERGAEQSVLWIKNLITDTILDGPIDRLRASSIAWLPDGESFYYVRELPAAEDAAETRAKHRRVYLHRVGTDAEDDVEIFGAGLPENSYLHVALDVDGHWLYVSATCGYESADQWVADLRDSTPEAPAFRPFQVGAAGHATVGIGGPGELAYVFTDLDAPRRRLCVTEPDRLEREHWRTLVPEEPDAVLETFAMLYGDGVPEPALVCLWSRHGHSELTVHDLGTGQRREGELGTIALPGIGTVSALTTKDRPSGDLWFLYEDVTTPPAVYLYDPLTHRLSVETRPPGSVRPPDVSTHEVTYAAPDGTTVRMSVTAPAAASGLPDRPRPAFVEVYGGFALPLVPLYNALALLWVQAGGVFVQAHLRGGNEEGKDWHQAGRREHKQRTFDDLHAAAETLVRDGWASAEQLGIYGGSNGGLTVAVALTQRPELYAAAVCDNPLTDMVRYERFGAGATWSEEYGTAADPEQLGWLLSYSPYHAVRAGTDYPAVLVAVSDGDQLVDPMHARKMCAALQHATSGERPVLLRRETDVGHGARSYSRAVAAAADQLAFLADATGLDLGATTPEDQPSSGAASAASAAASTTESAQPAAKP